MTLLLQVLGGVLALALGVYLGQPAARGRTGVRGRRWKVRRESSGRVGVHDADELEQLERDLATKRGLRRRAKRHFTPLDLLRTKRRASETRGARRRFRTAAPSRPEGRR